MWILTNRINQDGLKVGAGCNFVSISLLLSSMLSIHSLYYTQASEYPFPDKANMQGRGTGLLPYD